MIGISQIRPWTRSNGATAMVCKSGNLNIAPGMVQQDGRARVLSLDLSRFSYTGYKSRVERLGICLIVMSLLDLLLTYFLLYRYSPVVYEANPVAEWFFLRWNIFGM